MADTNHAKMTLKVLLVASFLCFHICLTEESGTSKHTSNVIRTNYGDTYDCVEFYKQPAFSHPMLKSLEIIHNPIPEGTRNITNKTFGIGCPSGTVPIRRAPKRHLLRRSLGAMHLSNISSNVLVYPEKGHQYAIVRTRADPSKKYLGTEAHMSIYNPSAKNQRYTAAQMRLRNGPDSIQAGWMVNPALFGDLRTRLFVHFATGQAECYNTECPGFVQVSTDVPLGHPAEKISVPGGQQYSWKISIKKDVKNNQWTVRFGEEDHIVGYWPSNIFSSLGDSASQAEWGGEVYSPPGVPSPWMGNGDLPQLNTQYAAYFRAITLYDDSLNPLNNPDDTEQYVSTDVKLYNVQDLGFNPNDWGRVVLYGGEGGAVA